MALYFAYGSNMSNEQMRERCSFVRQVGAAVLNEHRLVFCQRKGGGTGVATILPSPTDTVFGVLYEVTEENLKRLDMFEGVPKVYKRIKVCVDYKCKSISGVWIYVMVEPGLTGVPSDEYSGIIKRAAAELSFPLSYLKRIGLE